MGDDDEDQAEIMDTLAPYFGRIYPLFDAAIELYNADYTPKARAEHSDRATANNVYCHAWQGLEREFADEPGFHFLKIRGSLNVLNVKDRAVIRLKKVDANGLWRNHKSKQQIDFDAQKDLPGIPRAAARLVLGYQPDPAFSRVERVTLRRPKGRWVSQIVADGDDVVWVDITPKEFPFREGRRHTGG
jgi:hypothetical protein